MTMSLHDTIAAIATAPGTGGIGIIRMSGPDAAAILMRVFRPARKNQAIPESHRLVYGKLTDGEQIIDECMAVIINRFYVIIVKSQHNIIFWIFIFYSITHSRYDSNSMVNII